MLIKLYSVALPILVTLDFLWLGVITKGFYAKHLGYLLRSGIAWPAVIVFYLLFTAGLVVFVISPAVEKDSLLSAVLLGALFGLIAYATYDLTNLATIRDWPLIVTIVDLLWGAIIASAVSTATYWIVQTIWK